jgi:hypothetical protein
MGRVVDDEGTLEELPPEARSAPTHDDLHIVLECDRPLAASTRHCLDGVDEISFCRGRERRFRREPRGTKSALIIEVPDSHMSSRHGRLRRLAGTWVLEDAGSRNGSYVQGRRVDSASLGDGARFELGHTHFLLRSRPVPRQFIAGPGDIDTPGDGHPAFRTLSHEREAWLVRLLEAAKAGASILLVGEAGSGKDTLARALHDEAERRGPFVSVPCPLLGGAPGVVAVEPIAVQLRNDFERAAGGTLFLDEIEGLSPLAQLALLPLLRSPARAGKPAIVSSVRSSDLGPQVPRILADLLAELAGFTMPVPPLRAVREDIGGLVARILEKTERVDASRIHMDPAMGRAVMLHDWPYNVSELDRCIRTAAAQTSDGCMRWSPSPLFRAQKPAAMESLADEGALVRAEKTPPPVEDSAEIPSQPEPDFVQQVRRALKCNLSVAGLQRNGLLHARMVLERTRGSTAVTDTVPALREVVLSAIDALRTSSPRGDRQARVLDATFVKPAPTQQEAADQLAMAFGTFRRYVTTALAELTSVLWFNELSARRRYERGSDGSGPGAGAPAAHDAKLVRLG